MTTNRPSSSLKLIPGELPAAHAQHQRARRRRGVFAIALDDAEGGGGRLVAKRETAAGAPRVRIRIVPSAPSASAALGLLARARRPRRP